MKIGNNIYIVFLTSLMLTACSELAEMESKPDAILFSAGMASSTTRGGVTVQNISFDHGEEVAVFIKEHNASDKTYAQPIIYKATTARDSETGGKVYYALGDPRNTSGEAQSTTDTAWPPSNVIDINAFHPKGAIDALNTAKVFTVQADQSTDANYRLSDLMAAERLNVARQDERVQLTFTHLLSKVIITLKGDRSLNINHEGWRNGATAVQQTAAQVESNSKLIGAKVELLEMNDKVTVTSPNTLTNTTGSQTIVAGTISASTERVTPADETSAWQLSCIVPSQNISSARKLIRVTTAENGVLWYTGTANLVQSAVNTFNIVVHAKELTLTGNVAVDPWTVGDTDQGHEAQPLITL